MNDHDSWYVKFQAFQKKFIGMTYCVTPCQVLSNKHNSTMFDIPNH